MNRTPREHRAAEEAREAAEYRDEQEAAKFRAMLDEHLPAALAKMEKKP